MGPDCDWRDPRKCCFCHEGPEEMGDEEDEEDSADGEEFKQDGMGEDDDDDPSEPNELFCLPSQSCVVPSQGRRSNARRERVLADDLSSDMIVVVDGDDDEPLKSQGECSDSSGTREDVTTTGVSSATRIEDDPLSPILDGSQLSQTAPVSAGAGARSTLTLNSHSHRAASESLVAARRVGVLGRMIFFPEGQSCHVNCVRWSAEVTEQAGELIGAHRAKARSVYFL